MIDLTTLSPQKLAEYIKNRWDTDVAERQKGYEKRRAMFKGGKAALKYLERHIAEGEEAWDERKRRFRDCGLTKRIGWSLVSALYGRDIKREIQAASPEIQDRFSSIFTANRIGTKQRVYAQNQVVAGDAFTLLSWSERLQRIVIHSVDPANVAIIADDDDPMTEYAAIECRPMPDYFGKEKRYVYWIWTMEAFNYVDDKGFDIQRSDGSSGWEDNAFGFLPYTHWRGLPSCYDYWGESAVEATAEIHIYVNNLKSEKDLIVLYQAHSLLTIADSNAEEKLTTGPKNAIVLSSDGKAAYINPGADLGAVQASYDKAWEEAFHISGIPTSIVKGGEAPSGFALVVEYRTMAEIIADLEMEAREAEQEQARKLCRIASMQGLGIPEDAPVNISFASQVVPADKEAEFQRDLSMLNNIPQLMTRKDFIAKHRDDVEDVEQYLSELDAEELARRGGLTALNQTPQLGKSAMPLEERMAAGEHLMG